MQVTRGAPKNEAPRLYFGVAAYAIGWIVYVTHKAETPTDALYPIAIFAFGIVPTLIWIARWRHTLPMMPIYGLVNILHFGLPFTSATSEVLNYSEPDKLASTATVCGFLAVATLAWALIMGNTRASRRSSRVFDSTPISAALPYGFATAIAFNWAEMAGSAYMLGSVLPVVRALCGSIFFVSAYLFGALWADGKLSIQKKILCSTMFAFAAVLTWPQLYLYPSMFVIAMFFIGYMISARRIPVALVIAVLAVFAVLQSGKSVMRAQYEYGPSVTSIMDVPGFVTEWVQEGLVGFVTPGEQSSVQLSDRIGLMHMLLRAQAMTPSHVDFLGGGTYLLIPRLLVPRFIDPDKPIAHAGLIMLNIRYGLLLPESVDQTSIGWGMLPEAYANFGNTGVAVLGIAMAALFALVTLWSSGAPALSGRAMFGVMLLISSFNLEADTALFITNLLQGAVAIFALNVVFGILGAGSRRST